MWGRITRVFIIAFALLCSLATLASFAGSVWWPFDLFSHFRVQLALATAISTLGLFMLSRWRIACIALAVAGINIADVGRLYVPSKLQFESNGAARAPTLSVLHVNAWGSRNRDPEALARYLDGTDFDLVFVQESSAAVIERIASSNPNYVPIQTGDAYRHGEIMAFVNQARAGELDVVSMKRLPWGRVSELRLRWHGRELAILSPHVSIPAPLGDNSERELECAFISEWVNAQTVPTIVIGDLNATPWCKAFRTLLTDTELVNSQQGFGVQGTWPRRSPFALSWLFTIPIDHCLHSGEFVTIDRRIGPYLGSDHLPLEVELGLRARD